MTTTSGESLIAWIVQCYGHCIPRNARLTGKQFAASIREIYDTSPQGCGPINDSAARIAEQCPGVFYNQHCTMGYEQNQ